MSKLLIFDFNRTLFDPEKNRLTRGVQKVLSETKARGYKLRLLAQARPGRTELIKSLNLHQFFKNAELVKNKTSRKLLQICSPSL